MQCIWYISLIVAGDWDPTLFNLQHRADQSIILRTQPIHSGIY